jgi:NitT/TauT family transport system substrate-binding protein
VVAVNTLGVVSLLTKDSAVNSLDDLAGKTVYAPASAKGAIPEIVFSYLLAQAGLTLGEDVKVEWLATAPGGTNPLAPKLKTGEIVLSPEPAATALLSAVEGARRAVVFDNEWKALENGSEYITGVTVVRTEFAEKNPKAIADFLTEYEASIAYANENAADTAAKVIEFKILEQQAPLIEKAIPNCHISFLAGSEMKAALGKYYSLLVPVMPKAFGGTVPADGLYYVK